MIDVRRLLAIKADIETAMQRDIDPLMRVVMQRRLDAVCKEIEEAREEFGKLFEQQELDQLKQRVKELEASNKELLEALETCCIATQGKQKAFCECFQHDSRPCLDMEGVCWFGESGNCSIWNAIQKARGQG